jgi:hypothetical protein
MESTSRNKSALCGVHLHNFRALLLTAVCATAWSTSAAQDQPMAVLRVQRVEFVDTQGFEKPLVAATIMVPAGWRQKAAVEWNIRQQCTRAHSLRLSAQAPDGSAAIELTPEEGWGQGTQGTPVGDCPAASWRTTQEYLAAWVQRHRPGARFMDYRLRPERSQPEQKHAMPSGEMRFRVESGQALIAYTVDGREVREAVAANVSFAQTQLSGLAGGPSMQTLHGHSRGVLSWRAPNGQLDFRQFDAVWDTLRPGAEWQARMQQGQAQMARDGQRTQAEVGRIQAQTSRETLEQIAQRGQNLHQAQLELAQINAGTWRAGQATTARMHTDSMRGMREVQAYRDPQRGGVVEFSVHYRHAWQLRDGTYVLTDNASFNPNRDAGMPGVELVRTR